MAKRSSTKSTTKKTLNTAYDEVPYISYPYSQTNPLMLQGIAKLFGMSAPDPDAARVLEIGCASGNNIMAIASNYPKSKCIGIDYSAAQIAVGQKAAKAAGLKNIELKHLSVMDIDKKFGQFDYIIVHGVLSWVPEEVQEKIFDVCSTNLAKDGIAYISYNTLPGWNSVKSLRDMMLYHTKRYNEPAAKVQQARLLLKFVGDALRDSKNPMAEIVEREFNLLAGQSDHYLMHDHLEENNHAFYFHEFMERAAKHGLQYVADTSLEKMYSGNFPNKVMEVLATSNDFIRTEQYMDFLVDRRFRSSLLCHNDRILNRNIQSSVVRDGWIVSRFTYPADFKNYALGSGQSVEFKAVSGMTLTTRDPIILALMQVFFESKNRAYRIQDLAPLVEAKLAQAKITYDKTNSMEEKLCLYALRYLFINGFGFYLHNLPMTISVSAKPALSSLARYQAAQQDWVTSQRQECLKISPLDKALMPYLDGTRTQKDLCAQLLPHFASGELAMNDNNVPVTDAEKIKAALPAFVEQSLERYAELGLLVA